MQEDNNVIHSDSRCHKNDYCRILLVHVFWGENTLHTHGQNSLDIVNVHKTLSDLGKRETSSIINRMCSLVFKCILT